MFFMLERLVVGPLKTNCYILMSSDETVVIDPGWEGERILSRVRDAKLNAVILTHGHFDHVMAANMLKKAKNTRILIHKKDLYLLKSLRYQLSRFGIEEYVEIEPDGFIEDGDELRLNDSPIKVIHTPGHTPGSTCLLWEGKLFSGDTLFRGTFGRVDLPGGSYDDLVVSMRKLLDLPNETLVFPGHGDGTTIGAERDMMMEMASKK
jgi:glyoxylase-like metal-dependent hydrolase (beta-lactamase superfamily II)